MLLSYQELITIIDQGVIDSPKENVNAASIDITLHNTIQIESISDTSPVDLMYKKNIGTMPFKFNKEDDLGLYFELKPGQFILASSNEIFNLPNDISAEYMLKSSLARNGLEHLAAGWCDAGWYGSTLTLELTNVTSSHTLLLRPGMKIGQMKFFRHTPVPDHASYATKGQYNGDLGAQAAKKMR